MRNNAHWCDIVSRAHGASTEFGDGVWTSCTRTPPFYPDAVTLQEDVSTDGLLSRIDTSPGCSLKDSFARLDLSPFGFRVLFDARWIMLRPVARTAGDRMQWRVVSDGHELRQWEDAWRKEPGADRVFPTSLVRRDDVTFLVAAEDGMICAGAILHATEDVVGLSNYFEAASAPGTVWRGCVATVRDIFPKATVVGYERIELVAAAQARGFDIGGPLRVWTN